MRDRIPGKNGHHQRRGAAPSTHCPLAPSPHRPLAVLKRSNTTGPAAVVGTHCVHSSFSSICLPGLLAASSKQEQNQKRNPSSRSSGPSGRTNQAGNEMTVPLLVVVTWKDVYPLPLPAPSHPPAHGMGLFLCLCMGKWIPKA